MNETFSCDVLVIGGGPAGVVAALSAARTGADTILVTDRPVLGGNSSSEVRVWTRGSTGGGNLFAEEMGIWGELKLENLHRNPTGNVLYWDEILLDAVLSQPGLRLFLNTLALDVRLEANGHITSVTCRGTRTEKDISIFATQYVDCTGDGFVAQKAGIPFRVGREGQDVFGESLAQRKSDSFALGCSLLIQSKRTGRPAAYIAPSYVYGPGEIEQLIGRGGRIVTAEMSGSDCWWFEYGGQLDIIGDDQAIAIELRRIALGIWNYIKNSGNFDADDLELEWIGAYPGRRASRRLIGKETLTQQDVVGDLHRDDAVCYGGWFMDSHPSGGIQSEKEQCQQLPVHCYGIPLACFFNPACDNLLFAGRNISTSYMAFTSSRIMNTCAMTGQAAGTAAAMCASEGLAPLQLWTDKKEQLLARLAEGDALLTHPVFSGLSATATVTASSQKPSACAQSNERLPLRAESYVAFPAAGGAAILRFEAQASTTLRYRIAIEALPSRRSAAEGDAHETILRPGVNDIQIVPPAGEGFAMILLEANEAASLVGGSRLPGVQAGECMEAEHFYPYIAMEKPLYAPENAVDGYVRPWNGVHIWAADGMRPEGEKLKLHWDVPVEAREVLLYFDLDLSMELVSSHCPKWDAHHHFARREGMPPMLVKDYRLVARKNEKVYVLADVRDNTQRFRVHHFEPMGMDMLTLRVTATWGGDPAVYQFTVR